MVYMTYKTPFSLILLLFFNFLHAQEVEPNNSTHEKWEYILEDTGDVLQLAIPATALIATLIEKDYKGTKQFAYSYGSSLIIAHTLKKLNKKQRPENRNLYDSFPSGHTTSAFSGASFIQRRYGWKYGIPAYTLATIVGVSRMEGPDGWHDTWDVLAGAAIGIGTTYIFTTPYQKEHFEVGFKSGNESYLLTFKYTF